MYCSRCGAKLDDDANFCSSCGNKIIRESNDIELPQNSNETHNNIEVNESAGTSQSQNNDRDVNNSKIDLDNNIVQDDIPDNMGQQHSRTEEGSNRIKYGNKEFIVKAQRYVRGAIYISTIKFYEKEVRIKKEKVRIFKRYKQEYSFNIDDVLYVNSTRHISKFMLFCAICLVAACMSKFGIRVAYTLVFYIFFSVYRTLNIGFKNGDEIRILSNGIFRKRICNEIIDHINRISESKISNDKNYSKDVIIKNILSIAAIILIILGIGVAGVLMDKEDKVKINNPYKEENTAALFEKINGEQMENP